MSPRSLCSNPFYVASTSNPDNTNQPAKSSCTSTTSNSPSTTNTLKPTPTSTPSTFIMSSPDKDSDVPRTRTEPRPDFSKPLPRKALPAALQETLDNEEKLWDTLYDGSASESTESNVRYAAYASRVRTILLSAHRYVAYTSDIGESFRPVAHPWLIKGAYGVSWAYLIGDVAHEGYKARLRNERLSNPDKETKPENQANSVSLGKGITAGTAGLEKAVGQHIPAIEDYRAVMAQRAVFQGLASMGLPAFTIHSIVKYSGKALRNAKNVKIRTYGPIGVSFLSAAVVLGSMVVLLDSG